MAGKSLSSCLQDMVLGDVLPAKLGAEVTPVTFFLSACIMSSHHKEIILVSNVRSDGPCRSMPIIE